MMTFACELSDWLLVEIFLGVPARCSAKRRQCYHGLSVLSIGEAVIYDDGIIVDCACACWLFDICWLVA